MPVALPMTASEPPAAERRRRLAAAGLVLGPPLFMLGEVVHHQVDTRPVLAAALACLGLYLWIAGILGIVHLLRPDADRLGLLGGAAALLGAIAVSNIMVIQLVFALVDQKVESYPELIRDIFNYVLFVTYLFGPVFPAALAVLAGGLLWQRIFPTWITVTFLSGALTFPVGRVGGVPLILHVTDFLLAVGAMAMGWQLWKRAELWNGPPERPADR
ncbi:MAG: hypothetical protein DWQ31_15280 [Planctomycetota bacterium]|nr:MAG: hypothetical protein DWQ31_15280 [Planctomycetota bacterium]REJ87419.1 MAG: hypothetical protein DWQ35_21395 [Planctomycetota bacterium]REK30789.1 MAG: hypothetical protein DWQ42_01525 [Planctomycetota bacterium]REK42169.1 MAG: hypothetical protein DWQ46_14405 [Planctomycetota bacterium]